MTIKVVKDPFSEAEIADFVVCYRVQDLKQPAVPAYKAHCKDCGQEVWVALTTPTGPPKLCIPCAKPLLENDDDTVVLVSQRQVDEVLAALKKRREH
jgi:hypothetical protein